MVAVLLLAASAGAATVTVSPAALNFGNQPINTASAPLPVTVTNNQTTGVTLTPPTLSGVFALAGGTCGTTLAPSGSCTYLVTFTPNALGPLSSVLNIAFNASGSPISVDLSGAGVTPVAASPASITFPTQITGTTSAAATITVTNYQSSLLTLSSPTVTGDYSVTGGSCVNTLAALQSCTYLVSFTPVATGVRSGSISVNDNAPNSPQVVALSGVGINRPGLASVVPGSGILGTAVSVTIKGNSTHFATGSSVVSAGTGITVSNVVAASATQLTATFTIAAAATPGARTIKVVTGTETESLTNGFIVTSSAPLSLTSISPPSGTQGQNLSVAITGSGTHFAQGTTTANFGIDVTVNSLTVTDSTHATASLSITPTASTGGRTVQLLTGGELAIAANGFTVSPGPAALKSVSPTSAVQGANLAVTLTGVNTHFLSGATQASFGAGINVGAVTVVNALTATANIAVTASATVGLHDVTVTTGSETETEPGAFTVIGSTPYLSAIAPSVGQQGQTLSLTITGVHTSFGTGATNLALGSNITLNSLTVNSATSITANISIATLAAAGERTATLSSNGTNFPFGFTVQQASTTAIASISPASGPQGVALAITVTGSNTHWSQANTTALFLVPPPGCSQLAVNKITVASATSATLNISVPPGACVGVDTLQMSTGGEVVTGAFTVAANTPTLVVSPSNAMPGTTLSANFFGDFTHFVQGTTTAAIDGQGVAIGNFKVTSLVSATATLTVAASALAGSHTVTLTTGTEIVTAGFSVTTAPAYLLNANPASALLGATETVQITGVNTHFAQGITTLGFGPNVAVTNLAVASPTSLSATIAVAQTAALGWRNAYVNTGAEQLAAGFLIVTNVPTPVISAISPASGEQGQTLTVTITGQNTHFGSGTEAIVGAGVTVANLVIHSATSATATVTISPTAPVGPNPVILITGSEIASGAGFYVAPGTAEVVSVTPNVFAQNETVNLKIVGQGTHWLQGETTASFGSGVVTDQLAIQDATHATAQITVLSTAPLGFQTVSFNTDGEVAILDQGTDIQAGTPALLSSNPNSGEQGVTMNVQVLGEFTHWVQGTTTASFGDGITVNSFTVLDSVSGIINITVNPTAYIWIPPAPCNSLTITTGANEQVSLGNQFCILAGPAELTALSPASASQGSTATIAVTGVDTHFAAGVTTASFGGGINAGNVTVISPTQATVPIAVTTDAGTGFQTVTLSTLGENASVANTFSVTPGVPTLNGCSPVAGAEQGQTLNVQCIGQFTHWAQGTTTATFGQGITVNTVTVGSATTLTANVTVDPLAFTGGRTVTVTTPLTSSKSEIVSAGAFSVIAGPAIITGSSPVGGNQGQEIVLTITGTGTHWIQGLTQFSIYGVGSDITLNNLIINSPTSATADVTIGTSAALGARSLYMVTAGEALTDAGGFIVTGGIPSITTLSPNNGVQGATGLTIQINGFQTKWTSATTVDFGPGITVTSYTVNNNTSITAVINIGANAASGYRTVAVRTGTQGLTGAFQVLTQAQAQAASQPVLAYYSPGAGLPGQTFTVNFTGRNTSWDPKATAVVFTAAGITVNGFQVTSPTSALANISIAGTAAAAQGTVTLATGTDSETAPFSIVIATPVISIVDPGSAMQGETLNVDVLGTYTTFRQGTTVFNFGSQIKINSTTVLGPTAARVNITIPQLASQGPVNVTETTGSENATDSYAFDVTPSTASITGISPNAAGQSANVTVTVTGQNTHWTSATVFSFGGSGITIASQTVNSRTSATLNLSIAALTAPGVYYVEAQTGGEVAYLDFAFVVQPTTPLLLSSGPVSAPQQGNVTFTILGQQTQWVQGTTTVSYGDGVTINTVTVTSPTTITVAGQIAATTYTGARTLTVTTGSQVLTLPNAFSVGNGPAAINALTPSSGKQGQTLNVTVAGTNTDFASGATVANFGPGVVVNSLTVTNKLAATANVSVSATATPALNTVTLTTLGEVATGQSIFEVVQATPVLSFASPSTGFQGTTASVTVDGLFTHFNSTTSFNFGAGITVNSVSIANATTAVAAITISPIAALGSRNLTATTTVGTATEVASGANLFAVQAGAASLVSVNPATGKQGQSAIAVTVTGKSTHFTQAAPSVSFGPYISVTQVKVTNDTTLVATINVSTGAPIQANDVTVTTGGEVATLASGFSVTAGTPVLSSVTPNSEPQGESGSLAVTGLYTHFAQGTTTASFGAGVTVNSVTVNSATQATVAVTVQSAAATGPRTVTLTTGTESASLASAFSVTPAIGTAALTPTSAVQGQTLSVAIAGSGTHFAQGTTVVSFGGGISVQSLTVTSNTAAVASIVIPNTATVGAQTVTITTGQEIVTTAFTVIAGTPVVSVISPNTISPTQTVSVTITGNFTNWGSTTKVSFGAGVSVGGAAAGAFGPVTVNSPTSLTANVATSNAALGPRTVQVQTGTQTLSVGSGVTVQTCTTTAPTVVLSSPVDSATDVPVNAQLSWQFSVPMNRGTFSVYDPNTNPSGSVAVRSYPYYEYVPGAISLDASGRVATFIPNQPLSLDTQYYWQLTYGSSVQDSCGNALGGVGQYFTTDFSASTAGPKLLTTSPVNKDTAVPTNAQVVFQFDRGVDPITVENGVTVTGGGTVTGTWSFSTDGTVATFVPTALTASKTYTVAYSAAVLDDAGFALNNPGSFQFTTGAAAQGSGLQVTQYDPPSSATGVGLNVHPHVTFNLPIDPITLTSGGFYLYDYATGQNITGTIAVSADRLSATLTPSIPLTPETYYALYVNSYYDLAGNYGQGGSASFTTGTAAITAATTVSAVSPASGATGIPTNSSIQVFMSGQVDPISVTNAAIKLSPAVSGGVALASDSQTLTFTPAATLAASTKYTVSVGGFNDLEGNAVKAFTSTFTTGTAAGSALTYSIVPNDGASGVAVTSKIVLAFSAPVDPLTVNTNTIYVQEESNNYLTIGGTYSVSGAVVTFTPYSQLPGNATIRVYVNGVQDTAGDPNQYGNTTFTTAAVTDTTAPKVVSVFPANGSANVGLYSPVVLTFSKSLNPSTVNANTITLFNGDTPFSAGISISADNRTVTLAPNYDYYYYYGYRLPPGGNITVVVSNYVQDLSGNAAAPFTSSFTATNPAGNRGPSVIRQSPGSGAVDVAPNATITLFLNGALNASTINGALHVADNGVIVPGTATLVSSGTAIEFTPSAPFGAGDTVEVFLDQTAIDVNGNAIAGLWSSAFTVTGAPVNTPPLLIASNPANGIANAPANTPVQLLFDQPLDPATVSANTVSLYEWNVGYVTPTLTLSDGNRLLTVAPPSGSLDAGAYDYQVYLAGVKNPQGQAFANTNLTFYNIVAADTAAPKVLFVTPPNKAVNIGSNAPVAVTFNKAVDPVTVNSSTLALTSGGVAIPATYSFNGSGQYASGSQITVTPQVPLPSSATVSVAINGVTSEAGVAVAPQTTAFTTLAGPDYSQPYVVASSLASGETNVPTNATFVFQFNKPLDPSTLNPGNFSLYQYGRNGEGYGYTIPVAATLSADLMTLYLAPAQSFYPYTQYNLNGSGLTDLSGNAWSGFGFSFTTGLAPSTTGPSVVSTNPETNDTQFGTSAPITVTFNEPVQQTSLGKITLVSGASAAALNESFDTTGEVMTITPASPLLGSSPYTLTVAGVTDMAGHAMTATTTVKFTTAPSIDFYGPSVTALDPASGSVGVGINVHPHVEFSAPIDPRTLTSNGFYLYDYAANRYIYGTVTVSADRMSATLVPAVALLPQSSYNVYVNSYTDLSGNSGGGASQSFTTAAAAITGGTTATLISPASGATGVPLNSIVDMVMSTPIDPVTLTNAAIILSPAAPGIVSLGSDGQTIWLTPAAALAPSTTYTVTVGGFNDAEGNPVAVSTWKFTTGGAAASGMQVSIVPQSGATGVAVNSTIIASFTSTALDAQTVNASSFSVNDGSNGNREIAGTYAINGGNVTFTPLVQLPGNATINVYVGGILDTAGNSAYGNAQFTTANVADVTPPKVTAVTPANGAANIGLYAPVAVTFSKSIDPSTASAASQNIVLFNGDTAISSSIGISADNRTVSLVPYGNYYYRLPPGASLTLVVTSGVLDLSGNPAVPFTSTFSTITPPSATGPSVVRWTPGVTGDVAATTPITLFVNAAMNPSTIQGALHVIDNGTVASGSIKLASQNQAIEFTPTTPFGAGDLVQVYLETSAEDANGNPLSGVFQGYFTVAGAPASTGPSVVWTNPANGASNVPLNTPLQVLFDQPIDPASLSGATATLYEGNIGYPAVTMSLSGNNRILTVTPASGSLDLNSSYSYLNVSGLKNQQGETAATASFSWNGTVAADTTAPKLLYVTPPNKATKIGTDAAITVTFNKPIDEITANSTTVTLSNGTTAIPVTYSFNTGNAQYAAGSQVIVTPQVPLPGNATLTVSVDGVTGETGVAAPVSTTTFTTLASPDFGVPYVIEAVTGGDVVPTNAVMSARFNKPIDPSSYNSSNVQINEEFPPYQPVPVTVTFSSDLTAIFLKPTSPLTASSNYVFYLEDMTDLSGNSQQNYAASFTTAAGADTTALKVTSISPPKGFTGVATNAPVQILFNGIVDSTTTGQITLSGAGKTVPVTTALIEADQAVQLSPAAPLTPNTLYTISVAGVKDLAGNALAATVTSTFTTGAAYDVTAPTLSKLTPASGATSVTDSPTITAVFSEAMDPISYNGQNFELRDPNGNVVPMSVSYSTDLTTWTFKPTAALTSGATYSLYISYFGGNLTDLAGNGLGGTSASFTTQ